MLSRSTKPMTRARMKRGKLDPRDLTWAAAVRDAAGGFCQRCGNFGHHSHHVASRKRRPDLRHEVSNGRYLCAACHDWVHANPIDATEAGWLSDAKYELRGGGHGL